MKRLLCFLLALVMAAGSVPVCSAAAEEDGLCSIHHARHDESCGYTPAREVCGHTVHDDTCDNAARVAAIPVCECPVGEDGVTIAHAEACTYEAEVAAAGCSHVHGDCGYGEEIPCLYAAGCPSCIQQQSGDSPDSGSEEPGGQPEENRSGLEIVSCEPDAASPNKLNLSLSFNGALLTDASGLSVEQVDGKTVAENPTYDGAAERFVVEFNVVNRQTNLVYTDDAGTEYKVPLVWSAGKSFFAVIDGGTAMCNSLTMEPEQELKVKFYYDPGFESQLQNYTPLTSDIAVGDQQGLVTLSGPDTDGYYTIKAVSGGETGIAYSMADGVKVVNITVGSPQTEQLRLLACNTDNSSTTNTQNLAVDTTMQLRCFLAPMNGGPQGDPILTASSDNAGVFQLELKNSETGVYELTAVGEGSANIVCTVGGADYAWPVTVGGQQTGELRLLVCEPVGAANTITTTNLPMGRTVDLRCFMAPMNGGPYSDNPILTAESGNEEVFTLSEPDAETGVYTLTPVGEGSANIVCTVDGVEYSWYVSVVEAQRALLITPADSTEEITLNDLEIGTSQQIKCYLSDTDPAAGDQILESLQSGNPNIVTLSGPDEDGVYTVTPVGGGTTTLTYTAADGTKYSREVSVLGQADSDGVLYYSALHGQSGQYYPKTCVNMNVGSTLAEKFYFGDTLLSTATPGFSWSGPIDVVQLDDGRLSVEPAAAGTGYLEYTVNDITHCFVVNVGRSAPDNEVAEGGYMWFNDDVVLRFGDPRLDTPDAGVMEMLAQVSSGFGITTPSDHVFRKAVAFAAQNRTEGVPEKSLMDSVSNVNFSILCCNNCEANGEYVVSIEKEECETVPLTNGLTAHTNYLVAGGTVPFVGLVGMTFDIPDKNAAGDTITRRISLYLLTHNTLQRDVTVDADDIDTAAELNAILSSYEALLKWVKDKYPGYDTIVDLASNININLPGGDFTDTVVVSQAIATCPFVGYVGSGNPNFRVYLYGSTSGEPTRMAGLISRGSMTTIMNVEFVANDNAVMTMNGEEFTCGLLADSSRSADVLGGIKYDAALLEKYGDTNGDGKFDSDDQRMLAGDFKDLDCDIMAVMNCSFAGFDYGTRSTPNGYVGSGMGNSFRKCFYGIYIDCAGKPGWSNYAHTGFSYYDFRQNAVAVRIKGLQKNATPYNFRIQDSDFINNHVEFWIDRYDTTYLQNYYFYRNYYGGGWKHFRDHHWKWKDHTMPGENGLPDGHRGPRYHSVMQNGVKIFLSGSPSRIMPNLQHSRSTADDTYWIYGGDDQVTRILDDQDMPIAKESLEALTGNADVSVVDAETEDTLAIWTFEGGN